MYLVSCQPPCPPPGGGVVWLSLQKFWWHLRWRARTSERYQGHKTSARSGHFKHCPPSETQTGLPSAPRFPVSVMDRSHQKEEKREAGRKMAYSEWFVEAHESQFENVPFCTAVAATLLGWEASWIPLILSSPPRPRWIKSCKDSRGKICDATLFTRFLSRTLLPTPCECSYQIFLRNPWAARGQGGQTGQTCGCFTWRTCVQVRVVEDNEMGSSQLVLRGKSWRLNAKVKYLSYAWELQIK